MQLTRAYPTDPVGAFSERREKDLVGVRETPNGRGMAAKREVRKNLKGGRRPFFFHPETGRVSRYSDRMVGGRKFALARPIWETAFLGRRRAQLQQGTSIGSPPLRGTRREALQCAPLSPRFCPGAYGGGFALEGRIRGVRNLFLVDPDSESGAGRSRTRPGGPPPQWASGEIPPAGRRRFPHVYRGFLT